MRIAFNNHGLNATFKDKLIRACRRQVAKVLQRTANKLEALAEKAEWDTAWFESFNRK